MKPQKGKVFKFKWIARILGFTFAVKLMENGEEAAQDEYELLAKEVEESAKILTFQVCLLFHINFPEVKARLKYFLFKNYTYCQRKSNSLWQYAHFDLKLCIFNFFNFDLKIMHIAKENQLDSVLPKRI